MPDNSDEAEGFLREGDRLQEQGDYESAVASYYKALTSYQQQEYHSDEASTLLKLADTYDNLSYWLRQSAFFVRQTASSGVVAVPPPSSDSIPPISAQPLFRASRTPILQTSPRPVRPKLRLPNK